MHIKFIKSQLQELSKVVGFEVNSAYVMEDDLYLRGENHLASGSIHINFASLTWGIQIFEIDHKNVDIRYDFWFPKDPSNL